MIEVRALRKQYGDADHAALDGVELSVPSGCVFGLLGPNGAGKTTLISILAGLLDADSGEIRVNGRDPARDGARVRAGLSVVPQAFAFHPTLTAGENLALFSTLTRGSSAARLERAIELTQLGPHLKQRAGRLSGGLQRRLNLALGLLGDARLLFLDEPTAGVDPQSRQFLVETVRQLGAEGCTVLYTSHYLDEIERACSQVAILDHGRVLCSGALAALLAGGESLEALFLRLTHRALRE